MIMSTVSSAASGTTAVVSSQTTSSNLTIQTLVATTATSVLANAIASPINSSQSNIQLQSFFKLSSETDTLVELGRSGGTLQVPQEDVRRAIEDKLKNVKENAKNPDKISQVRCDLSKLYKISSVHFYQLKEEIFDFFIHLLENDPISKQTAEGVLEIVIDLNNELTPSQSQQLSILFQRKVARAFSAAVELYLRHYDQNHVNAITESQKKAFIEIQSSFSKLNKQEDARLDFANQMAMEASKRLTSDNSLFMELLQRLLHVAKALGKAYEKDIASFFSELKEAVDGLDSKIKEKWFETLFVMRELVQKAPDQKKKVLVIQSLLVKKLVSENWKFIYGALELLQDIIAQSDEIEILEAILFGQSSLDNPPSQSQKQVRLLGVIDFIEFKGYVHKAKIVTNDDKKADSAIRDKAEELFQALVNKLTTTIEGRRAIYYRYAAASMLYEKKPESMHHLGRAIPENQKMREEWLKGTYVQKPTLRIISVSLSISSTAAKISEANFFQNNFEKDMKEGDSLHSAATIGNCDILKLLKSNHQNVNSRNNNGETPLMLAAQNGHAELCKALLQAGANPKATSNATCDDKPELILNHERAFSETEGFGWNAMHYAAKAGRSEIVTLLSVHKQLIDSSTNAGTTPLMLAAAKSLMTCELLIKLGADPLKTDMHKLNALHFAARSKNKRIVELIAVNKHLINSETIAGETPLMLAARESREICEILLEKGAKPFLVDENGANAMHYAADAGKMDVVQLLSKYEPLIDSKDKDGTTPFLLATKHNLALCEMLLKLGANPQSINNDDRGAIHFAAIGNNEEVVSHLLLKDKKLINAKDKSQQTPLILAAKAGHEKVCRVLLEADADASVTDGDGLSAMHYAALTGKVEIVRTLSVRKQLFDLKSNYEYTPLMFAAKSSLEACNILKKAGADIYAVDKWGKGVMHHAAEGGNVEVIRMLSVHKQLIDAKNQDEETPLMLAAKESLEACEILLKAGADPFAINQDKRNAMHFAAFAGKDEIVRMLSVHPRLIDSKDYNDRTPLMLAAENSLRMCKTLINKGANPLSIDSRGRSALHYAAEAGKVEIVEYLSSYKSLINLKDEFDITALILAARTSLDACEILLEKGALPSFAKYGDNVIYSAALFRKEEILRKFSDYHAFINFKSHDETPLMRAAMHSLEACEILLKAGADPYATSDTLGHTPMHYAHEPEIISRLAKYEKLLHLKCKKQQTPLMHAATCMKNKKACKALLDAGSDPLATNDKGQNAMHLAVLEGVIDTTIENIEVLSSCKNIINSKDNEGKTPLMLAANRRSTAMCEALLKAGADPHVTGNEEWNAMHIAALFGKTEIILVLSKYKKLLDSRAKYDHSPLTIAASSGNNEACKALLNAGADPLSTDGLSQNAMHYAAQQGNVELVKVLSVYKPLIDSGLASEGTPLIKAASEGHREVCEILLKAGANPLESTTWGKNALHLAAERGKTETVKLFITNKTLLESKEFFTKTALLLAAENGHREVCEILLKAGADPSTTVERGSSDENGHNAMHLAAKNGKTEVVQLLLAYKHLINAKTKRGNKTPLMLAAIDGHVTVCEVLLKAGADRNITDGILFGSTALDMATAANKTEVLQLLSKTTK